MYFTEDKVSQPRMSFVDWGEIVQKGKTNRVQDPVDKNNLIFDNMVWCVIQIIKINANKISREVTIQQLAVQEYVKNFSVL